MGIPKPRSRGTKALDTAVIPKDSGWYVGDLSSKLRDIQKEIYEHVRFTNRVKTVVNAHRGLGKSFLCGILGLEKALSAPGQHVKIISPTQKMTRAIMQPILRELLSDCPEDLAPKFKYMDGTYEFPNGSTILTAGSDMGQADTLRGTTTHLVIYDEAGFMDHLAYLHGSVIAPRLLPTGGKAIFISTPPISPKHYFAQLIADMSGKDGLFTYTVRDNKSLDPELLRLFIDECGGENTTAFRREFLCEIITDDKHALFPEIVREEVRFLPPSPVSILKRERSVIGVDLDLNGLSAAVFCGVGPNGIILNDSRGYSGMSIENIIRDIRKRSEELYGDETLFFTSISPESVIGVANSLGIAHIFNADVDPAQGGVSDVRNVFSRGGAFTLDVSNNVVDDLSSAVFDEKRKNIAIIDTYRFPYVRAYMAVARIFNRFHANTGGSIRGFAKDNLWSGAVRGVLGHNTRRINRLV